MKRTRQQTSKSKYYCFTVNNPPLMSFDTYGYDTSEWPVEWDAPWREYLDYGAAFVIWSLEKESCLHIQGYIELVKEQRYTALKKWPGLEGAHFEPRGGTQEEAIWYCEKNKHPEKFPDKWHTHIEGPFSIGKPLPQLQGKARKLNAAEFVRRIRDGRTDAELWEEAPNLMLAHGRKISEIRQVFNVIPERNEMPKVMLFIGAPGTGKSRTSFEIAKMLGDVFVMDTTRGSGLYWDGYHGQKCVWIDEMDGHRMSINYFKQLTDRYPFKVHPIGKPSMNFNSPYIFITSNTTPSMWWEKGMKLKNNREAVMRRVTVAWFFPKKRLQMPPTAFDLLMSSTVRGAAPARVSISSSYCPPTVIEFNETYEFDQRNNFSIL